LRLLSTFLNVNILYSVKGNKKELPVENSTEGMLDIQCLTLVTKRKHNKLRKFSSFEKH